MNRLRPAVRPCAILILASLLASPALADVKLPKVFGNHMLLQRGLDAPVWGWADPGETVTVRFAGQTHQAEADDNGRWIVRLTPLQANDQGQEMVVAATNEIKLADILIGDVWICSGQSNMEWTTRSVINAKEEVQAADFPTIRLFDVPGHTTSPLPKDDVPGGDWQACTPESVAGFSAVGYFFARHIHRETGVPVGLIGTNWGGTRIEPWTPPIGFRSVPELKNVSESVDRFDVTTPQGKMTWTDYVDSVAKWTTETRDAIDAGKSIDTPPETPGFKNSGAPTAIYNSMVHGLAPYGTRGAIWYQGESNGNEGVEYLHKMHALIGGWRQVWNQGEFPLYFYFVQLADFQKPNDDPKGGDGWARLREAQLNSLKIANTGMAVITDIGAANDIHPRNKQDVGYRLALWALRDVANKDVVVSGPLYREIRAEGDQIRVHFDHVGGGLMIGQRKQGLASTTEDKDGNLKRFAVAGEDKVWHWADATIDGDCVVVSSDQVPKPVAVRYAYTMNPEGANLYNREGLPASPFRSDSW